MSRQRIHHSEAQANAEALARRSMPFAPENQTSAGMAYDFRRRQPRDLRDAVELVRRAYRDEVPTRLHERGLASDGTPAMTPKTEAYIFGSPTWTDAGHSPEDRPLVAYYLTPFRATLDEMERASLTNGDENVPLRKRAAIVRHITIGAQGAQEAAMREGVPIWAAKVVAMDALTAFLRRLSDVKVDTRKPLASEHAAA